MEITKSVSLSISSNSELVGKKFGVRAMAFLLDIIISAFFNNIVGIFWGVALGVLLYFANSVLGQNWNYDSNNSQLRTWLQVVIQIILYFGIFEWLYGRTLGKVILKMRVVSHDGNLCSFKQAIVRSLYRLIDGLFFGVIAFVNMKPSLYQRLGDKRAGTLVVNSEESFIKEFPKWQDFLWATLVYMFLSLLVQSVFMIGNIHAI